MYGEGFPGKKVGGHSSWELLGSGGRVKLMLSLVSMEGGQQTGRGKVPVPKDFGGSGNSAL